MSARNLLGLAGFALGVALLVLLITQLGISSSDLNALLGSTPISLIIAVTAMTLCVQIIGALRWRKVMDWLAPDLAIPSVRGSITATSWGSFFGQFLPIQLAMPAARWMSSRNGSTIGSTLYEGLFDFVILASGGIAAALVLLAGFGPLAGLAIFAGALLCGCLALRPGMAVAHWLCSIWSDRKWIGHAQTNALVAPLERIENAPPALIRSLAAWSVVKLLVLSARLLVIALVFAGPIDAALVGIGYPIVGLTLGVPFIPAGLGLADWSWTGILVLAGAGASVAGMTAIAARVLNFIALFVIVAVVMPIWKALDRDTASSQALA